MKKAAKPSRLAGRCQIAEFEARLTSPKLQELSSIFEKQTACAQAALEPIRRQLMTEDERADEDGEKRWRAYWAEAAESIRSGELTKFYECVNHWGPHVFVEPEVQAVLRDLWLRSIKDEAVRKTLEKICPPLAKLDPWRPAELTDRQKKENRKASTLDSKQNERALKYCDAMWGKYKPQARNEKSKSRRQIIAENIISTHSHGGKAKQEGIRLFRDLVRLDLASLTVGNK